MSKLRDPLITLKKVGIDYQQQQVVTDVSVEILTGDYLALVGPNGAGKTTLIKAILGLVPIQTGKISLKGRVGYLPQKASQINQIFPAQVSEIILLGLINRKHFWKRITSADKNSVREVMAELKIEKLAKKLFSELSGGQQQKVLLARALVSQPEILIFDEPSTALDPQSREAFFTLLARLNRERGVTIILITHDVGYIGNFANKLMYLDKKLVYYGDFADFCKSAEMTKIFGETEQHLICHQHQPEIN